MKKYILVFLFFVASIHGLDRFVVVTPERTGTHLLTRALSFLTGKPVFNVWERAEDPNVIEEYLDKVEETGRYFHMHAFPDPQLIKIFQNRGYKVIFLLRDPRDHLISV